ncbi:MAG: hypothetical protein BMS9Abin23_0183 [Thermodesulfobacteriota bacterium]|nr:MAG: hypothetical protein BMS9Abin23_0183 [Thermodesulfobacteriota bacterium]
MSKNYVSAKIALFEKLFKERGDVLDGGLWMLDPEQLRFKHGMSIADLKIPYHMGAEDEAVVEEAVLGLVSLLKKRYESMGTKGEKQKPLEPGGYFINTPPLRPKTYRTDLFVPDTLEKELAARILATTPYVDSGVLCSWLGNEGHGKKLIKWIVELFEKALKDDARQEGLERTSYLTLLAVLNTVRKKKKKLKDIRLKCISYDRLDLAVGLTLFNTMRTTIQGLMKKLSEEGEYYYSPLSETLLCTAILPKIFLSIPSNVLALTLNPYSINQKTYEILKPLVINPDEEMEGLGQVIEIMAGRVRQDPGALAAVKEQYGISLFRREALKYMMEFDIPDVAAQSRLYDIYKEDSLIENCLKDPSATADLIAHLEGIKKMVKKDQRRLEVVSGFLDFLSTFPRKKTGLKGFFGGRKQAASEAVVEVLRGVYALELDNHTEGFVNLMMGCLTDRRGELASDMLLAEYKRGSLYRFSTDSRPLIKTLRLKEEGQLFVDMKDFTRRTSNVKEIAMVDFMKDNFFKPILGAASRYAGGAGLTEDEQGIRLTNIPGDAVIFSGGVAKLVSLAKDIKNTVRETHRQIERRLPQKRDEEILEKVHNKFEARRRALKEKRLNLTIDLGSDKHGLESKLISLGEEESRLESIYKEEIQAAIKCEVEAGLFISYGTKAEVMLMEPMDGFFGPVAVSIGEKINEASRGTFRHPLVRANLEILLSEERKRRKNANLRYPFDIYIHTTYSLRMPPDLERAFEKLIANRKLSNAKALSGLITENYLSDFKKIISGEPFSSLRLVTSITDIYNKGEALSHDALDAYMKETRGGRRFFKKALPADELDESIGDAFFFPHKDLEFIFSVGTKGKHDIDVFNNSGQLIFRGFETSSPTTVYEMLDPEGDFYKALIEHHFSQWFEEAETKKDFL